MMGLKDGPLRKWFNVDAISDEDFRTAMTEAYHQFSAAIDQETAARMRRRSRVGVDGLRSQAEIEALALVERRRGEIVLLLGGLLGAYLPEDNLIMLDRAKRTMPAGQES